MTIINDWIQRLNLQPHPEGGFYRETYRAAEIFTAPSLPGRYGSDRSASTAIYFLLHDQNISHFHRLQTDEIWHFYAGDPLLIHVIEETGAYKSLTLSNRIDHPDEPQVIVPAHSWFAAHVVDFKGFALVGCTLAPGFDFADFELGEREKLIPEFPRHAEILEKLCMPT